MTYRSELYLIKSDNTEIPANIIANTLYLNKSYCEEEQLEIGGCIPSQFKCSVYGIEDITDIVKLKYIRYSNDEPDISFEGIIEELTSTSNDGIYNITAYDVLYNQDDISAWYNNYMATHQNVTISQLYNAVLEKLGLIGNSLSNYITYDFVIKQNILSNNITGTRLLKWICEALGVFGILDTYTSKNGTSYTTSTTFDLGVLGPRPVTAISPFEVFSGFQKSDYVCKKIDKVQIRSEKEDIGAIYGTGTNALIIEGNPLFYGMNASELEKCAKQIASNLKDNSDYTAYEAELNSESYLDRPLINPLSPISSSTSSIYSYIFNITWSGSQLTTCKIGANGVETRSEVLTSTNSEIIKLNYKTTSIVKNVDGIKTEVSSISSKTDKALTSIEQTDKYIETNVVKNDEVVTKINASQEGVSIKADKISLEGYTTINDNFKIDKQGNMEAKNGKFSGEITSTSGTIGGFTISDKLTAKGQNYLPPTEADFNKIKNAVVNSTTTQLYNQNPWFDLNGDGKINITDMISMRSIILGKSKYSSVNHKKLSDVTIEINPASTDKTIRIYGTNAWGSLVDTYIGSVSSNIDNLSVTGLNCSHGLAIGSNDVWTEEQGLKAQGDIIAGFGTDNQVSLQNMKGKCFLAINDSLNTTLTGSGPVLIKSTSLTLPKGNYIAISSAIIMTSRYTSNIRLDVGGKDVGMGVTNEHNPISVPIMGHFEMTSEKKVTVALKAYGQDSGTTVTVPAYNTYNILIFKIG